MDRKKSDTGDTLTGVEIDIPQDVENLLLSNEKVLYAVKQTRLEQAVTPDSIVVTTHRIIVRRPTTLGLKSNITDYRYVDMANTRIDNGLLYATIFIEMRFLSEDCVLKGIPKKSAAVIFRIIEEQISQARDQPHREIEDPIKILQFRLAKGEITKEEYISLKKELDY